MFGRAAELVHPDVARLAIIAFRLGRTKLVVGHVDSATRHVAHLREGSSRNGREKMRGKNKSNTIDTVFFAFAFALVPLTLVSRSHFFVLTGGATQETVSSRSHSLAARTFTSRSQSFVLCGSAQEMVFSRSHSLLSLSPSHAFVHAHQCSGQRNSLFALTFSLTLASRSHSFILTDLLAQDMAFLR